jgi:hypothetical protein
MNIRAFQPADEKCTTRAVSRRHARSTGDGLRDRRLGYAQDESISLGKRRIPD